MSLAAHLIRLNPKQQSVVWGGSLLHERLGKPAATEPVGESWEVWEGNRIEDGPYTGITLRELTDRFPREVLGSLPSVRSRRFPLLTKFIDAQEPLSIQVHPDDALAQSLEGQSNGKTEAWYIIAAEDDSWVIHGLVAAIDAADLRLSLEKGTADDLFRKIAVRPGDVIFVPAGVIHAIGPGVLLHEVQQTSDVTYRLYDWNRQTKGTHRELHLDKGLRAASLQPSPHPKITPLAWRQERADMEMLLASRYFAAKRMGLDGAVACATNGSSFHIVTALDGGGEISTGSEKAEIMRGDSLLVAATTGPYQVRGTATMLVEFLATDQDIRIDLASHGLAVGEVDQFLGQFQR